MGLNGVVWSCNSCRASCWGRLQSAIKQRENSSAWENTPAQRVSFCCPLCLFFSSLAPPSASDLLHRQPRAGPAGCLPAQLLWQRLGGVGNSEQQVIVWSAHRAPDPAWGPLREDHSGWKHWRDRAPRERYDFSPPSNLSCEAHEYVFEWKPAPTGSLCVSVLSPGDGDALFVLRCRVTLGTSAAIGPFSRLAAQDLIGLWADARAGRTPSSRRLHPPHQQVLRQTSLMTLPHKCAN